MKKKEIEKHLIFKCITGSKAYGVDTDKSDIDVCGIALIPNETFEQFSSKSPDVIYYNLKRFCELAVTSAPNIIELLFTDNENILMETDEYKMLRKNRNIFMNHENIVSSFGGLANSMLRKSYKTKNDKRLKYIATSIRTFQMGSELLTTGNLSVRRPNASTLKAIRNGRIGEFELSTMIDISKNQFAGAINKSIISRKLIKEENIKLLLDKIYKLQ